MKSTFRIRPYLMMLFGLMLFFSTTTTQAQTEKIWGGVATDICDVPWQVSIEFFGNHRCGGTIISPQWVVSAAHCWQNIAANNVIVHAGSTDQTDNSVGQRIQVDQIINHVGFTTNFNTSGVEAFPNDIALLHLSEPLCFDDCVQAAAVANANTVITPGMAAIISGWGDNGISGGQANLLSASLPVISDADANILMNDPSNNCSVNNPDAVGATTIAFFELGEAAGQGDSGGPAVINIGGTPTLVGNSSWGGCDRDEFPTMYSEVAALSGWIASNATPMSEFASCDASFSVSMEEDDDGNLFFSFNNPNHPSYTHTWTVLSHDVSGTGPYTTVAQSSDPDFEFDGTLGGCYTIIHQVETPCETCCYVREVCNKSLSGEWTDQKAEEDCADFCGLITPGGLDCFVDQTGYLNLTWDEVIGAVSYVVELTFNDPDCCPDATNLPTSKKFKSDDNTIRLDFYPICMSWTVTAICEEGKSPKSEKMCFDYKNGCNSCLLDTPVNLSCHEDATGYLVLTWDEVSGATGYTVTMTFRDPACCPEGGWPSSKQFDVDENFIRLDFYPICMSWTVTAHCPTGKGQTSKKVCFDYKNKCGKGKSLGDDSFNAQIRTITAEEAGEDGSSRVSIYPNPTSDVINYMVTLNGADRVNKISILDLSGKVVEVINYELTDEREVSGSYVIKNNLSGLYLIQVQLDSEVITEKVMIVK